MRRFFAELGQVGLVSRAQQFLNEWGERLVLPRFRGQQITPRMLEQMEQLSEKELGADGIVGVAVWAAVQKGRYVELRAMPFEDVASRPAKSGRLLRAVP